MASSLVRGKYVISKVTGPNSAVVISDGAVLQQDGLIIEVGEYQDLRSRYPDEEVIGSSNYVVMPGLVNDHFHVGLTPFSWALPTCRWRCGAWPASAPGPSTLTWISYTARSR